MAKSPSLSVSSLMMFLASVSVHRAFVVVLLVPLFILRALLGLSRGRMFLCGLCGFVVCWILVRCCGLSGVVLCLVLFGWFLCWFLFYLFLYCLGSIHPLHVLMSLPSRFSI